MEQKFSKNQQNFEEVESLENRIITEQQAELVELRDKVKLLERLLKLRKLESKSGLL